MAECLPISVLVPTYNRASTLPHALHSVLGQSCPPAELIVIDDGSTDETGQLVAQIKDQHRRASKILLITQANAGVSAARNRGIDAASYPWIALLDSDDRWTEHKLKAQWQAHTKAPQIRLWHTDEIWIRNGVRVNPKKKHQKRGGSIFAHCLPLCCISPSSAMLSRDLLQEVGPFDTALLAGEDYDLWLRICAREPVGFVQEALVIKYGGHADQLSAAHWGMDRFRVYALEKLLLDPSCPLNPSDRELAHQTLRRKLEILLQGALKRDRGWLALRCRKKLAFWKNPSPPPSQTPRLPVLLEAKA